MTFHLSLQSAVTGVLHDWHRRNEAAGSPAPLPLLPSLSLHSVSPWSAPNVVAIPSAGLSPGAGAICRGWRTMSSSSFRHGPTHASWHPICRWKVAVPPHRAEASTQRAQLSPPIHLADAGPRAKVLHDQLPIRHPNSINWLRRRNTARRASIPLVGARCRRSGRHGPQAQTLDSVRGRGSGAWGT